MQRNCTHATKAPNRSPACPWARPRSCNCTPPLPSTSPGTKPAPTVPRAVLQHMRGYDSRGKHSPPRANTEPHPCNETAPMQRTHLTAPQHVPGHELGHNCSPRRATAHARLRFTRKTFPGASLKGKGRNHTQETKTTTHSPCETAQTTIHHGRKTKTKSKIQNLEKRVLSLEYGWEEQRDLSQ